jgi:hypothetical protein
VRFVADVLAGFVGYEGAVAFERVGGRQPDGTHAGRCVDIDDLLMTGKLGAHQHRPGVVAKILRLVWPRLDEESEIEPGSDEVLVEIECGKAVRGIPATTAFLSVVWIEWVRPVVEGDPEPMVSVWELLGLHP